MIFYDIIKISKSRTKSKTNVKGTVDMTKRKLLIIISAVIVVCLVAFSYFSNNYIETGLEKYNEKISQNSNYINFSLNELGSYDDVYFQSTKTGGFIFSSYGSMLIASYNDADFIKQLNSVNAFNYQSDVIFFDDSKYTLPETEFYINDWHFKVLEGKSPNFSIPKDIDLIAVNESSRQIAYLTFYDQDIDYLCKSDKQDGYMKKFVKKYFKYKF